MSPARPATLSVLLLIAGLLVGCGDPGTELLGGSLAPVLDVQPTSGRKPGTDLAPTARFDPGDDALQSCQDVPIVTPEAGARQSGVVDLDPELIGTLSDYGADHADSFAGLWLDGESSGGMLLAFADDAVGHRDEIMAELGQDSWQAPFSVVDVPNSTVELEGAAAVAEQLEIPSIESATVNLKINRIMIGMLDPTEDDLTDLGLAVDPVQTCLVVTVGPDIPDGPLQVLPTDGRPSLLNCDEFPFPAAALDQPIQAAVYDHPAVPPMAEIMEADPGWIVLSTGDDHALFGRYDGEEVQASVLVTSLGGVWEIDRWTFGCDLKVGLPRNLGAVEIFLDPDGASSADGRTVELLVAEVACAGGREMGTRLLGPEVIETDTEVLLAFAAVQQNREFIDCGANPTTSVTVRLSAPLHGRSLVDGMFLPPRPVDAPRFLN